MPDQNWDDLRVILAVARARSLAGAARVLKVNETTVARRVEKAERRLGVRLAGRIRRFDSARSARGFGFITSHELLEHYASDDVFFAVKHFRRGEQFRVGLSVSFHVMLPLHSAAKACAFAVRPLGSSRSS